jgi:hypothetical protein
MKLGVVALFFRCDLVGGSESLSDETSAVRWLTPAEVEETMAPTTAVRLLDAIAADGPHIRAHDGVRLFG